MPPNVSTLVQSAKEATSDYLQQLRVTKKEYASADDFIQDLMKTVGARNLLGPRYYNNPELIGVLKQFTKTSMDAAGFGQILPSCLKL
jgi:hypothetical protein